MRQHTNQGVFLVWVGKERSDLHHFERNSYEVTGPDGHKFQQYEKDNLRRQIARRYGFKIKEVKELII